MDLEPEEALAIRWHMGATPWVWRLHQADMCAAWVDEREAEEE